MISGDQNGNIKVWDLKADACREEYQPIPDVPVRSISIAFDASMVAVGSQKGKLLMYTPTKEGRMELTQDLRPRRLPLKMCN